jgi:putative endonuclease
MRTTKRYYVYILASKSRVLYTGVTGNLMARVLQHKADESEGFTKRYHVKRLVYYESFQYVNNAITRETEIKKWRREKKVALIERDNLLWDDLAVDWGKPVGLRKADSSPADAGFGMTRGKGVCAGELADAHKEKPRLAAGLRREGCISRLHLNPPP